MNAGDVTVRSLDGLTVTVRVSPILRLRLWLALFCVWLAVQLMGADELRVTTVEAPR